MMEMDGDGWRWMEMDGYGWIWMDMDGYGWIWMDMAKSPGPNTNKWNPRYLPDLL